MRPKQKQKNKIRKSADKKDISASDVEIERLARKFINRHRKDLENLAKMEYLVKFYFYMQKGFANVLVIALVAVLLTGMGYFFARRKVITPPLTPPQIQHNNTEATLPDNTLQILTPTEGETLTIGSKHTIRWVYKGVDRPFKLYLLYQSPTSKEKDGIPTWLAIDQRIGSARFKDGSFEWIVIVDKGPGIYKLAMTDDPIPFALGSRGSSFSAVGDYPFRVIEDETVSWRTYRNDRFGFSFSYPSITDVLSRGFQNTATMNDNFVAVKFPNEGFSSFSVRSETASGGENTIDAIVEELITPKFGTDPPSGKTKIGERMVDGERAVGVKTCGDPGCIQEFYLLHNDDVIFVIGHGVSGKSSTPKIFEDIMKTFLFTR